MGQLKNNLPNRALLVLTIIGILLGAFFPFAFLAQLISAGTLIAFMFVSIGIYALRRREGKDLPNPKFKMPFYPVLPALGFLGSLGVFWGLDSQAKIYSLGWFVFGMIIYFAYGIRHSNATTRTHKKNDYLSIEIQVGDFY